MERTNEMTPLYNKEGKHWNNGFQMFCEHCKEERHMNDRQRVVIYEVCDSKSKYYGEEVGDFNTYEVCNDCIKDYLKKNPQAELAPEDQFDSWVIANKPKPPFSKLAIIRKVENLFRSMTSSGFCGDYSGAQKYKGKIEALVELLEESFLENTYHLLNDLTLEERFDKLKKSLL